MTDHTPPLSVEQLKERVLREARGLAESYGESDAVWSFTDLHRHVDNLIAAVRAEGAAQIEQLEAENQRLRARLEQQAQP